jgi:energy-converting hydrogenase B subunit P
LKFVVRAQHIISVGGYIVERNFPYRNVVVVNKTTEAIKIEVPIFEEEWIEEQRDLGLEIIPVSDEDSYLTIFKRAKEELETIKENIKEN